jgi:hypothetical protein
MKVKFYQVNKASQRVRRILMEERADIEGSQKQRRYERLAATSQLSPPTGALEISFSFLENFIVQP